MSQGGIGLSDYSEGVRYDPSTTTYDGPGIHTYLPRI